MFSPRRGVTKRPPRQCPRLCGAETNRMTTDVVSATLRPGLARPPLRDRLKLEHVVMGGAVVALSVLVVLPLLSLLLGSVKGEEGLGLDHFSEVLSGRLYLTALKNSLILGAWTSLFSLVLGLVLAWAVSRTDVPGKPLIQLTATLSYLSPPPTRRRRRFWAPASCAPRSRSPLRWSRSRSSPARCSPS